MDPNSLFINQDQNKQNPFAGRVLKSTPGDSSLFIQKPRAPIDLLLGKSIIQQVPNPVSAPQQSIVRRPLQTQPIQPVAHPADRILKALAINETEGVKSPYSFHKISGDKALGEDLGKYQVTTWFLERYSPRYLGRKVTTKEFLANPQLQEDFMRNRVVYLQKQGYTPAQIADLHRNGSTTAPGSTQYKRPGYVKKFLRNLDS